MIVRTLPNSLLLIGQVDHAAMAEQIIHAWQRDGIPDSPVRASVLRATRDHDNGWIEPDRVPILDAGTGRILDFTTAPDEVRQGIWPRAVNGLTDDPYAAALVAEHAINLFERYREFPAWDDFFVTMEASRQRSLERAAPCTLADLRRDYFFVRIGDLASLAFCNGWREPQRAGEYHLRVDSGELVISPDPFAGRRLELHVVARELPNRRFESTDDVARAYRAAPLVTISGVARGETDPG